ncbi:MAG: winged helix DNA-binding domain-containing protein, partial [Actinomycetota bacterium]|nr:winged helix DNA-binding domain-containing protein [Actinomycetota bacterium]
MNVTRKHVLGYRLRAHQLDRAEGHGGTDVAILDLGVQNTGPDAAGWALVNRGVAPDRAGDPDRELVIAWTLRGAPHAYRREDIAEIAAAVAPFSDADAAKRIFDAAKPLREAGIGMIDALDEVAAQMRSIVTEPTVKGDMSGRLSKKMGDPYLRFCRVCNVIHLYEQPFRLAALRAGLELQPGTSPPVLQPIKGWRGPAKKTSARFDVIRAYLHYFGPATPKAVAAFIDAPVKDIKERWPGDAVEVDVDGVTLSAIEGDVADLQPSSTEDVRLLSPFDPYLQSRDRELVVPDSSHRKELW